MGKKLVYIQIVLLFIVGIQEMLVNSNSMQYLLDINLLIILVYCIIDKNNEFFNSIQLLKIPLFFIFLLFIEGVISLYHSGIDFKQFFWEVRTLFRFPLFLICCVTLLGKKDIFKLKKCLPYVFYLNLFFSLYQKYILNVGWDNIGGIFGTGLGVNSTTIIFLSVYFAFLYRDFFRKTISINRFVIEIIAIGWIVLFAELKIMVFLLPLIAFAQNLVSRFNYKKLVVFSLVMIAVVSLVFFYGKIYNENVFRQDEMSNSISNGYGTGNVDVVDRATAFTVIDRLFFKRTHNNRWLGIGMGGASDSKSFASNGFRDRWGWTYYNWFMSSYMYLENGVIGVVLYLSFWSFFLYKFWLFRKNKRIYAVEIYFSIVIVAFVCFFYNSSLRNNSAFFMYLCLSIPFLYIKKHIRLKQQR